MSLAKPPYRADLVGSFLRPDSMKAIRDVIRMQEDAGT